MGTTNFDKVQVSEGFNVGGTDVTNILFASNHTTVGGAAAEAITVTGALATDIPLVTLQDNGTNNVSIASVAVTADTLTVTFSGDPGNDTIISYAILRA